MHYYKDQRRILYMPSESLSKERIHLLKHVLASKTFTHLLQEYSYPGTSKFTLPLRTQV